MVAITTAMVATPAVAGPFGDAAAIDDAQLANMRGGFALPGGLDVAMSVRLDTSVDGRLLLRTVFTADQGAPTVVVYAPPPGTSGPAIAGASPPPGASAGPSLEVAFDRSNGVTLRPGGATTLRPTVSVGTGAPAPTPVPDGWMPLAAAPGGAAVAVAGGAVSVERSEGGLRIALAGPDLSITHLTGQAFGTVIANTGSNRAIDSVTTIDLAVRGATPETIGSSLMRIETLALDAVRARGL